MYQSFGLRQIINASGKMTALGGSAVQPAVADAMARAAQQYVSIDELFAVAGRVIADLTGAEDGCPTAGAAAGIALSTAAVITGTNLRLIEQVPVTDGLPNEILLQKGHAVHFGAAITQMIALGGGQPVEVGHANYVEREHLIEAISEKTAAILYVKSHHAVQKGMLSLDEVIAIGHEHGIPVIVDAAAEEDLQAYIAAGADLVIYSGGKAIGGPSSGMICGRASLIAACRAQYKGIGRAMKIGKETIIGLLVALQTYHREAEKPVDEQRRQLCWLQEQLADIPGIDVSVIGDEAGRNMYRARLVIDEPTLGMTARELVARLEAGDPGIYTRNHYLNQGEIRIDPRPLLPGQINTIAARIREIVATKGKEE